MVLIVPPCMCHRYRLRSKVEIENATNEFSCWQRFGGDLSKPASSVQEPEASSIGWGKGVDLAGQAAAQGCNLGWQWFKDPRLDWLGFRGIFPSNIIRKSTDTLKCICICMLLINYTWLFLAPIRYVWLSVTPSSNFKTTFAINFL